MPNICLHILVIVIINFCVTNANPVQTTSDYNKKIDSIPEIVVEVPYGDTVTLACRSNDQNHTFLYWLLDEKHKILGPTNQDYDMGKYRFEVLSGNLTVKAASLEEAGVYHCVSRGVSFNGYNIRSVRMIVEKSWEDVNEHSTEVNVFRIIIVIITLVILSGIGFMVYRIWKNRFRKPSYLLPSDDDEDEDSGDELFSRPGPSRSPQSIVRQNETFDPDTPAISTDFTSILDNVNRNK